MMSSVQATDAHASEISGLARRVAVHGLPSAAPLPVEELDDDRWAALVERLRGEKVIGLLAQAVVEKALPATAAQRGTVALEHRRAMSVALVLERELLRMIEYFVAAGIDYRVMKGPAVARTVYPDPAWRTFGDIDVLLRGEQFDAAIALLGKMGYRRRTQELRPGFDRRFGKGATLVDPCGNEIDLHRMFVPGRYGLRSHPEDAFCTRSSVRIGAVEVQVLDSTERFLSACYHAALGARVPTLAVRRDILQMMHALDHDPMAVHRLAHSWGGEPVVARAVIDAVTTLGIGSSEPLAEWARTFRTPRADRRALRGYTTRRSFARQAMSGLTSVCGMRSKAAYLAGVASARRRRT